MYWLKGIGAVVAGMVLVIAGSIATDMALQAAGVFPANYKLTAAQLLIATLHRTAWAILASALVARLAPSRAMTHALIFGAIGVALNILGAIVEWSAGAHWYPFTLAATALPCAWIGAKLVGRRAYT